MQQFLAGAVEDFTERHRDQVQVDNQGLKFRPGQRGKEMVLIGKMEGGHAGSGDPVGYFFSVSSTPIPRYPTKRLDRLNIGSPLT